MKKTTVRFAGVGAVLLLGALAIALAQHDSRENTDSELVLAKPPADPQPIPVDDSPLWGNSLASSKTIVRANDDSPAGPPSLNYQDAQDVQPPLPLSGMPLSASSSDNPLRGSSAQAADAEIPSLDQFSEGSSVQLASGEAPPKLGQPELPSTMPTMPAQTIPTLAPAPNLAPSTSAPTTLQPMPALAPPTSNSNQDVIRPPKPGWTQAPPSTGPSATGATPPSYPSVRAPVPSTTQSLSDTQQPAMPTTNLAAPPASPFPGTTTAMPGQPGTAANGQLIAAPSNALGASGSGGASGAIGQMPGASSLPAVPSARLGSPTPTSNPSSNSATFGNASGNPSNPGSLGAGNSFGGEAGSRSPYAGTLLGRLISNQPGNSALLGSQNPVMLIQKRMAGECQVGKKATVIITVRNAGNSTAQEVEVIDSVPSGASFAEAMPAVTPTAEGVLVWKLGEMGPGDERTITLQIIPERQGEMGSTAIVRFAAQASMRTLATLPKLELTFQAEPDVLIGSSHAIDVHVRNTGTGVARGVKLEADVPKNFRHETGDTVLEAPFGDIAPGESKRIRLATIAAEPGQASVALRALTEDGVQQEQTANLRVLAPALEAVITGPNRRYLDRQATFQIAIKNSGTATATNCEFTMRLPAGLNFNSASSHGEYKASEHSIMWSVPEWPAGHTEAIELTVLPVEIGAQQMIFQGSADLGVKLEARGGVTVEEQGELTFTIDQDADPIELSSSTTYTVDVRNVGRPDRNVELSLALPPGSEVLKVDAPVQARVEGDMLRFEPIPQMDGRTSQKFRIEVRHGKVGTQKVSAQLRSQNRPTLVIKEEATEVYNDRD